MNEMETDLPNETQTVEASGNMDFRKGGKRYYTTRREAENSRRKGDRIYFSKKYNAYYITRVSSSFWGW